MVHSLRVPFTAHHRGNPKNADPTEIKLNRIVKIEVNVCGESQIGRPIDFFYVGFQAKNPDTSQISCNAIIGLVEVVQSYHTM